MLNKILVGLEQIFLKKKSCYSHTGVETFKLGDKFTGVIEPHTEKFSSFAAESDQYTIAGDSNYNTIAEQKKLISIQEIVNRYIHSKYFEEWFTNPENAVDLNQTEGLTRQQVVDKVRESSAHVVVRFYYQRWTRTVGYRNPGENIIYCNRKYHDIYSLLEEASNIIHEFLHIVNVTGPLCGFQHDFEETARRPFSVNYRANESVENSKPSDF